jgi:putative transposase
MARRPRYFVEGQPHHVIQRGNNRTSIFATEDDYHFFLMCLGKVFPEHGISTHALVLMTNHIHVLVTPADSQSLPKAMQSLGCRYVQHFNRARRRTGTLWEGRYRSMLVGSVRYFLTCMRYIESNPVRAGVVTRPEDYRWSSYRANALGSESSVVLTPHPVYLDLGRTKEAREAAYRELCGKPVPPEDLEALRQATNRAWVLGNRQSEPTGVGPGSDPNPWLFLMGSDPGLTPIPRGQSRV